MESQPIVTCYNVNIDFTQHDMGLGQILALPGFRDFSYLRRSRTSNIFYDKMPKLSLNFWIIRRQQFPQSIGFPISVLVKFKK